MQSELSTLTKKQKRDKTDVKLYQVVNTFFNKDKINFNQFDNMKQEYKEYQRKFIEEHELREQQQMKFDTMIALQDQDIKLHKKGLTVWKMKKKNKNEIINYLMILF